jgi:hypothetical protein
MAYCPMVPGGHKNRMEPDEIAIFVLAVFAAIVAIGATAVSVIHLNRGCHRSAAAAP